MLVSSKRNPQTKPSLTKEDICASVCNIWSTPQLKDEGDEILIGFTVLPINHIKGHISTQDFFFDAVVLYFSNAYACSFLFSFKRLFVCNVLCEHA